MNFGYTSHGHHTIIKLNCKLSETEREEMKHAYGHDLSIIKTHTGLTRIQGCLRHDAMRPFVNQLHLAKLRSKRDFIERDIYLAEDALQEETLRADLDALAFADPLDELPF